MVLMKVFFLCLFVFAHASAASYRSTISIVPVGNEPPPPPPPSQCFEVTFHGALVPAPCYAEKVAARTRAIVDDFHRAVVAKVNAFYRDVIVPNIEAHLAALPEMLASGALTPGLAYSTLVDWPNNATYTPRTRDNVCALLKDKGFECSGTTNAAGDLFISWGL